MESLFFSLVDFMKELNYEKKLVSVQTLVTYSRVTFSQSQYVYYTNYVVIVVLLQELLERHTGVNDSVDTTKQTIGGSLCPLIALSFPVFLYLNRYVFIINYQVFCLRGGVRKICHFLNRGI